MQVAKSQSVAASLRDGKSSFRETRLRVAVALAWAFWGANRAGWLMVLGVTCGCALLFRLGASQIHESEGLRFCCFLPMVVCLILAAAFCNFTDRTRRDGIAGFPRHLFSLPANTPLVVTCAFGFGVTSVAGLYLVWAALVLRPVDSTILVRWPALLLAAGVVFYQAIVWCLCGFRLTRIISLSLVATFLVGAGCVPLLSPSGDRWATEAILVAILGTLMAGAYVTTLVTVSAQRRGGARGWTWLESLVDNVSRVIPHRRSPLTSPGAALFWMEWRRAGLVLPGAVLLTTGLMLSSLLWLTNRGPDATLRTEAWLALMPMLLAVPIGMGFGKPDFWTLDLSLSTFAATRPVSGGQLTAAKMKAAARSTLLAWAILLLVAPLCIYLYGDTTHWHDLWRVLGFIYSPFFQVVVPIGMLLLAIALTWCLMVSSMWLGYTGRPWFYYTFVAVGMGAFMAMLGYSTWWQDHPHQRGNIFVSLVPLLPWILAAGITVKAWSTVICSQGMLRRGMISRQNVVIFACIWLAAAVGITLFGCILSRRVEWMRDTFILAGLLLLPSVRLVTAPLSIAWNRHR